MEACEYELVFFMLDLNQWKWGWSNFPIVQLDGRFLQINLTLSFSLSPMFNSTCIAIFYIYISLLWNDCHSCDCIYCVEFQQSLSKQHLPLSIYHNDDVPSLIIIISSVWVCFKSLLHKEKTCLHLCTV